MKCPHCHKELLEGKKKEFETLIDHVMNPNMERYPLRPTWICECTKSKGLFWDWSGDVYADSTASFNNIINAVE